MTGVIIHAEKQKLNSFILLLFDLCFVCSLKRLSFHMILPFCSVNCNGENGQVCELVIQDEQTVAIMPELALHQQLTVQHVDKMTERNFKHFSKCHMKHLQMFCSILDFSDVFLFF